MNKDFLELTQDEMLSINGGMEQWQQIACATTGALLIGHSFLIGFVATPAAGFAVASIGVDLFGRALKDDMSRKKGGATCK